MASVHFGAIEVPLNEFGALPRPKDPLPELLSL